MPKRRLSMFLLLCVLITNLSGCGTVKKPEDTIVAFQDAFNKYDIDAMLDCVEPALAELVRNLLSAEGENYRLGYSLIVALVRLGFPVLSILTDGALSNDALPKLNLTCGEAVQDGDAASVPVDGTLTIMDSYLSFHVTINLRKDTDASGQWLISGLGQEEPPEDMTTQEKETKNLQGGLAYVKNTN